MGENKLVDFLFFYGFNIEGNGLIDKPRRTDLSLLSPLLNIIHVVYIQIKVIALAAFFFGKVFWCLRLHVINYTALSHVKIYYHFPYNLWHKIADKLYRTKGVVCKLGEPLEY